MRALSLGATHNRWRLIRAVLAVLVVAALGSLGTAASASPPSAELPCDIYDAAGTPCVAAYSSARALYAGYNGPLYQVQRASDSALTDIRVEATGGFAQAAAQDSFCAGTNCVVTTIYDQSPQHNNLIPQPATTAIYSNSFYSHQGVDAAALPITVGGHNAYGFKFVNAPPDGGPTVGGAPVCSLGVACAVATGYRGQAYNNGHTKARGVAVNGQPESVYGVFGGTHTGKNCCFDFGNSEISGTDTGNGHMDALNFSSSCWNACGPGDGPWVQADLENGMFMTGNPTATAQSWTARAGGSALAGKGFCCDSTPANLAMPYPFVTAMLANPGSQTFAISGADATAGRLTTFYDGPTPPGPGYSPMQQEGGIILGSGGDQGTTDGEFFEGAMTSGVPSAAARDAVQAGITRTHYAMR